MGAVTSTGSRRRVRKAPEARRAEIVAAAAEVALAEGLERITLRRIGDRLGVRSGLIGHYFPAVEDLVAEAFGAAAGAELDRLLPVAGPDGGPAPVVRLARFSALAAGDAYDGMSRLWLNARHLSRYRPVLRERVLHQQERWRDRLTELIREGNRTGDFRAADPLAAAKRILVVLDGLGGYANLGDGEDPDEVTEMAAETAERELGLEPGTLTAGAAGRSEPTG